MSLLHRTRRRAGRAIEGRLRDAIAELQSSLPLATARIELVEFEVEAGVAVVRVAGDCPDCDMSAVHLLAGIEAHLRMRVAELREVRALPRPSRPHA